MAWFHGLRLKTKLLLAFSLCALISLAVAGIGMVKLNQLAGMQAVMYETEVVPIRQLGFALSNAASHFRRQYSLLTKADEKAHQESLKLNRNGEEIILATIAYERAHATDDARKKLVADFDEVWPQYMASAGRIAAISEEGVKAGSTATTLEAGLKEMNGSTDPLGVKIRTILTKFSDLRNLSAQQRSESGIALMRSATVLLAACAVGGFLLALALGALIIRTTRRQIGGDPQEVADVVRSIAGGNLNIAVTWAAGAETSILAFMKQMQDHLRSTVGAIRTNSESVATSSLEIAHANNDLSARTEQQAASLEQTSASMSELTGTVKQNTANAHRAKTLATDASGIAETGHDAVQDMVGTIEKISQSSAQIADITGLIDGIAFQTNILALNAAVEAARAGEQGRGFAVVATEVRSLAQRSSSAAKEIKTLIESSVTLVKDGSEQAVNVGATMEKVKQAIRHVSDIVGEIAAASQEQNEGIEQIGQAVHHMDEVTQQNAALVEQAAAAATSLQEQAGNLKRAVSIFNLG